MNKKLFVMSRSPAELLRTGISTVLRLHTRLMRTRVLLTGSVCLVTVVTFAAATSVSQRVATTDSAPAGSPSGSNHGLVERSLHLFSRDKSIVDAKRNIQNSAIAQASEELIREIVGDDKYVKNKRQIDRKIITQYAKYIPFVRESEVERDSEGFKATVSLRVSVSNLRILLQDNGFLVESEGSAIVIPLINIVDRVNLRSYRWWQSTSLPTNVFFNGIEQFFETSLRNSFFKNNFYMMKPLEGRLYQQIPFDHQNERLSEGDLKFFSKRFNAPFALLGQVLITQGESSNTFKTEIKFDVIQVANSRLLANVLRRFETESGPFDTVVIKKIREVFDAMSLDLAQQVRDVWQRGAVGAHPVKLVFRGYLPIPWQEQLKEQIRTTIPQVKAIHENMILADQMEFKINSNLSVSDLAKKLEQIKVSGRDLERESMDNEKIIFKIKK